MLSDLQHWADKRSAERIYCSNKAQATSKVVRTLCLFRILYWTDVGTVPGIYRSPVDNPAQEIVVAGDIKTPNALTIDFTGMYSLCVTVIVVL